jgi:prepilin-type N-terminal cleavage/methylation domain-containing protein
MRAHRFLDRHSRKLRRGVTLVEIAIVLGIIGVMLAVAVPSLNRWQDDQRAKAAARDVADLLMLARGEAVRTGDQHVVYFGAPGYTDPAGTAVVGPAGTYVPMLVLNDGPPATANCRIDAGEASESFPAADGLNWGLSLATTRAPDDTGAAAFAPPQASGSTFQDPAGNAVSWLLFRPDGIPVVFTAAGGNCGVVGVTGTGGAAIYLTNGRRDYSVVLSPLGSVRVHGWAQGAWSS